MESAPFSALGRQREIYLQGLSGRRPLVPSATSELEAAARRHLSKEAFAYIAGGAGRQDTVNHNLEEFRRWRILPRMLRDVSAASLSIELLGRRLPSPFLLAPIGVLEMAHRHAGLAVARAAASVDIPMIFSNQASVPMEACAAAMQDSPRWFQLYWSKSQELVASFLERAEACGCEAIVVTLDTTMLGWRSQDIDLAYLPFLWGKGIAQYTSDPVFQRLARQPGEEESAPGQRRLTLKSIQVLISLMRNYPGSFWSNLRTGMPLKAVRKFISIYTNPALSWEGLPFLREHTHLPILLKGILHPDDARRAVDEGMDGIIVSNHGGRQVDGSISAVEALPAIVECVGGQVPVLLDSGIRGGADAFKAIALGARAVCIGRPYVYGLSIGGETGAREVMQNFLAEFELTMRLAGCRSVEEISPDMIRRASP